MDAVAILPPDRRDQRRDRRGDRASARRHGERCRIGGAGRAQGIRRLVADRGWATRGVSAENRRRTGRAQRRNRAQHHRRSRHAAEALAAHPGRTAAAGDGELCQTSPRVPVRGKNRRLAGALRTGRRSRLHHALEFSAAPDGGESGAGARRGLHSRVETFRGRTVDRLHAGGSDRRNGPACRRVQPGVRHRAGGRRGARLPSGYRHDFLHRLDARRQARLRTGGSNSQARGARTRRQIGCDRARRR